MKTVDDLIEHAKNELLEKKPFCMRHKRYLAQEEIDFKLCVKNPCKDYKEINDIDKYIELKKCCIGR